MNDPASEEPSAFISPSSLSTQSVVGGRHLHTGAKGCLTKLHLMEMSVSGGVCTCKWHDHVWVWCLVQVKGNSIF